MAVLAVVMAVLVVLVVLVKSNLFIGYKEKL
jgi:hypothetical protein